MPQSLHLLQLALPAPIAFMYSASTISLCNTLIAVTSRLFLWWSIVLAMMFVLNDTMMIAQFLNASHAYMIVIIATRQGMVNALSVMIQLTLEFLIMLQRDALPFLDTMTMDYLIMSHCLVIMQAVLLVQV